MSGFVIELILYKIATKRTFGCLLQKMRSLKMYLRISCDLRIFHRPYGHQLGKI